MGYYIGVDVGGTKTAYGLFDARKKLIAKLKTPTNTKLKPEVFFDAVCAQMQQMLMDKNIQMSEVAGIGVGMPSFIVFEDGFIVKTASIPNIRHFPLRNYLQNKLGVDIPIVVDNDGNTGALAEFRQGAGKGFDSMIFCLISTGLGSSLIINKSLFRGTYGWAGESGHMLINPFRADAPMCGCQNAGCFNSMCSGKSIADHVKHWIGEGEKTVLSEMAGGVEKINTAHIDKAFAMGDKVALKAVDQMAKYMAVWIYNIYLMLNINCFVFSGGLLAMGDKLLGSIEEQFNAYNKSEYPVYFYTTKLGEDTGIIGAMELLFSE